MTSDIATVDAVKMMRRTVMTVKVERIKELRIRMWIASRLLRLVGLVLNCNLVVEKTEER